MDIKDLVDGHFTVGFSLSLEEKSCLEIEMHQRLVEERLTSVKYWGKITGTTCDYLIAYGLAATMEHPQKKFYYCTSKSLALKQMPEVSPEMDRKAAAISGRFVGNPSKLLGEDADAPPEEEEEEEGAAGEGGEEEGAAAAAPNKPRRVLFSEAHRLALTVARIDSSCGLVPVGAFVVTPTHHVVQDPLFAGLSATEATQLDRFAHFRVPTHPARRAVLARAAAIGAGEFLDPICEDEHAAIVWRVHVDLGRARVLVRSLLYLGYFFFHDFGSPRFGSMYVGDGLPNKDISALPPPPPAAAPAAALAATVH